MPNKFRGYEIIQKDGEWFFKDLNIPTKKYEEIPCGHCGLMNTEEGHDGCLGTLPGIMNACCGHGGSEQPYVQYWDGSIHRGEKAIFAFDLLKQIRDAKD